MDALEEGLKATLVNPLQSVIYFSFGDLDQSQSASMTCTILKSLTQGTKHLGPLRVEDPWFEVIVHAWAKVQCNYQQTIGWKGEMRQEGLKRFGGEGVAMKRDAVCPLERITNEVTARIAAVKARADSYQVALACIESLPEGGKLDECIGMLKDLLQAAVMTAAAVSV